MYNQYQQVPKIPKLTKPVCERFIAHTLGVQPNHLTFVKLGERPSSWKHACVLTGAVVLPSNMINYYGIPIEYVVCQGCRKVQYVYETY